MDKEVCALIESSPKILAGISGGRDSMALLSLLEPYRSKLAVAHINYQTRSNSALEEDLVRQTCIRMQVPCFVLKAEGCRLDMPNFEAHARKVRYVFYRECAHSTGSPLVLTGQHRGDLAETVLLRLLRGSPRLFMKKIRPLGEGILLARPLLDWSREDITYFCETRRISWREDDSNESIYFLRNFLRKEVLPLLETRVDNLESRFALAARLLQEEDGFLQKEAEKTLEALGPCPEAAAVLNFHPALRRRILALMFEARGLPAPGSRFADEIVRKIRCARGGITLWKDEKIRWILKQGRLVWKEV